jgi:thiol:disulfide interchange protein DsbD
MERSVFPAPEVASRLKQFVLLRADVTPNDEQDQALLNRFGLFGPPSMVFFDEDGREMPEVRIQGEIGVARLASHLAAILEQVQERMIGETSNNVADSAAIVRN